MVAITLVARADIIGVISANLDLTADIIDAKKAIPLAEIVMKVTVLFRREVQSRLCTYSIIIQQDLEKLRAHALPILLSRY